MSRKKQKGSGLRAALIILIVLLIAAIGVMVWLASGWRRGP